MHPLHSVRRLYVYILECDINQSRRQSRAHVWGILYYIYYYHIIINIIRFQTNFDPMNSGGNFKVQKIMYLYTVIEPYTAIMLIINYK